MQSNQLNQGLIHDDLSFLVLFLKDLTEITVVTVTSKISLDRCNIKGIQIYLMILQIYKLCENLKKYFHCSNLHIF